MKDYEMQIFSIMNDDTDVLLFLMKRVPVPTYQ